MRFAPLPEGRLEGIWPDFLLHDPIGNRYWNRFYTDYPAFQFALVDGEYVVPGALAPVRFADGREVYREPCVWLRHDVVT